MGGVLADFTFQSYCEHCSVASLTLSAGMAFRKESQKLLMFVEDVAVLHRRLGSTFKALCTSSGGGGSGFLKDAGVSPVHIKSILRADFCSKA